MKNNNPFKISALALFSALSFGSVQATNAKESNSVVSSVNDLTPNQFLQLTSMCSNDPATTRRWRVRNHTTNPIAYTYNVYGTSISGGGVASPGDNFFETPTQFNSTTGLPTANTTKIFWSVDGADYQTVKASGGATCEQTSCYASEVVSFNQKKRNDGTSVSTDRSDATKALNAPQNNDTENFVSLGFGGDITLKFANPIKNGAGNDVRVTESTFGNTSCARYPETIRAFASQDGCHFVWIGDGCQDTDFDLGSLAWAQYIRLMDVSPVGATYQGTPVADGYDVDGVECLNGSESNPVPSTLVSGSATQVISYMPGLRKNGTAVPAARAIPANALGLPQGTNAINFVALGFGGSLVVKFDYVIFDNALTNDISLVETSYGNPSCASYSEKVMVEGSLDGINWVMLTNEDICQDGEIDINNAGVIQYIRITDRSASSKFSGTADGYDVDGLIVINECATNATPARIFDNTTTANEVASAEVFPNPFNESTNVEITTGDLDNSVTIRVVNFLGQQVYVETLNVASSSVVRHNVSMNELSKGVYFLTVETNTTKETVKLVKN
jgi:hypothetical protein